MSVPADSDAVIAAPLKAAGLVDGVALEKARAFQREHGGLLSEALLHLELVREGDFLRIFAEFYNTKFVKAEKLQALKLDSEVIDKIGARTAERLRMCPIRWDEERGELHVVAAIPLASGVEREARALFGARSVSIYVATAGSVNALIRRWFYLESDAFAQVSANGAGPVLARAKEELPEHAATQAQSARTVMVDSGEGADLETLRKEVARYRMAQEFNRRVTQERTMQAMVERVLGVVFDLLPAEGAAIALAGGGVASRGRQPGRAVEVPGAIVDQALASPEGVLVNNALIDERFKRSESVWVRGVQSAMAVPLRARGRTLGVLYVDSISKSAAFSHDDLPLLDSIGSQAALMLDNAELIARAQQESDSRAKLERFLSPAAVEGVLSGRNPLKLDGLKSEVTVLFADIKNFTRLATELSPEEVVALLNEFFTQMTEVVEAHEGTVDKFIGDCVMALWGAPASSPGDPRQALDCALRMVERARLVKARGRPIEVCIGVNTGEVVVGAVGSPRRQDFTAIGGAVNLAARLCSIARAGEILATTDTVMRAGSGVYAEPGEPMILKGLDMPLVPFVLRGLAPKIEGTEGDEPLTADATLKGLPAIPGKKAGR